MEERIVERGRLYKIFSLSCYGPTSVGYPDTINPSKTRGGSVGEISARAAYIEAGELKL